MVGQYNDKGSLFFRNLSKSFQTVFGQERFCELRVRLIHLFHTFFDKAIDEMDVNWHSGRRYGFCGIQHLISLIDKSSLLNTSKNVNDFLSER